MKKRFLLLSLFFITYDFDGEVKLKYDYPIRPVNFWNVKIEDGFWRPKLETNRKVTIPYLFRMNEETGRVDNFRIAGGLKKGKHTGKRYNDSDVFKAIESACYSLKASPDPELKRQIDELIEIIGKAQEPDGYLFTARTIDPQNPADGSGKERWSNLLVSHELYNLGHLYEAALAHFQATSEKTLLNIALKSANLLLNTFGPDKLRGFPGHQEIEIGLAKLYRVTGNEDYLKLAKFFLDERGHYHGGEIYPEVSPFRIYNLREYCQNHKPVLEQDEAVGHAVRATYMYSGMIDVGVLGGWMEYAKTSKRLWENVVGKKIYLTGGIGSKGEYEAFGANYELPNEDAYAETCASVGNALWNYKLLQLEGDGKYIDVFERIIYNGLLSGVSLSGDRFFYQNPLASKGDYERSSWFQVACCPANVARFLAQFPQFIYAFSDNEIFINLFVSSRADFEFENRKIEIYQGTNYPWEGSVKIGVNPSEKMKFTLCVRIPGWVLGNPIPGDLYRYFDQKKGNVSAKLNGRNISLDLEKGFLKIKRQWKRGDILDIYFPMPVRRVLAYDNVVEDRGKVAVERGPIVFCAEGVDNGGNAIRLELPDSSELRCYFKKDLLGGVSVIEGKGALMDEKGNEIKEQKITLIPYFLWANRGSNKMSVWLFRKK